MKSYKLNKGSILSIARLSILIGICIFEAKLTESVAFPFKRFQLDHSINETGRYLGQLYNGEVFICHYARKQEDQSQECVKNNMAKMDDFEKENKLYPFFLPSVGSPPMCPPLKTFDHGEWQCQDDLRHDEVTVYTSCAPVCAEGFMLKDDFYVRCTEFRVWDKDLQPVCLSSTANNEDNLPSSQVTPGEPDIVKASTKMEVKTSSASVAVSNHSIPSTPLPKKASEEGNESYSTLEIILYFLGGIVGLVAIVTFICLCYHCKEKLNPKHICKRSRRSICSQENGDISASSDSEGMSSQQQIDIPACTSEVLPLIPNTTETPEREDKRTLFDEINENHKTSDTKIPPDKCSSEQLCTRSTSSNRIPGDWKASHQDLGEVNNLDSSKRDGHDRSLGKYSQSSDSNVTSRDILSMLDSMESPKVENPDPCNCDCTVSNALNDQGKIGDYVSFVRTLGDLIDPNEHYGDKRSWIGLAAAVLKMPNFECIAIRHRTNEHFKELLINFESNNLKLGHILEYFTRKDSRRMDVVKLFEDNHRDCDYCESLYRKYDIDYLTRIQNLSSEK